MTDDRRGSTPLTTHFARELRILLASRDMSASELARRLNKPQPWIQRRLAGAVAFDLGDLEMIAAVFEMDPLRMLSLVGAGTTLRYPPAHPALTRPPNRPTGPASGPGRAGRRSDPVAA